MYYDIINARYIGVPAGNPDLMACAEAIRSRNETESDAIVRLYDACEKWLAANPGEYPYVRLFDAFHAFTGFPYQRGLYGAFQYRRPDDVHEYDWLGVRGDVTVTDENVMKTVSRNYLIELGLHMFLTETEYQRLRDQIKDAGGRGAELLRKQHNGGRLTKKEEQEIDGEFRKRYALSKSELDRVDGLMWFDIWRAFICADYVTAYEFLTKYCEVRPIGR